MGILPDWLTGWFARVAVDVGSKVADAVHWAIHAVASVMLSVFSRVTGVWRDLSAWTADFFRGLTLLMHAIGAKLWAIARVIIPRVVHWFLGLLTVLRRLLMAWVAWLWKEIRATIALLYREIGAVIRWAVTHIWVPLWHWAQFLYRLVRAWAWVAFWWITHLGSLAEKMIFHIAAAIERHAWDLAGLLGRFLLALIIRNLTRFVRLAEQIIAAVI